MNVQIALSAAFDAQAQIYTRALTLAQQLTGEEDATRMEGAVNAISAVLDEVNQLEPAMTPLREQWRQTNTQPGLALKRSTDAVRDLILRLQFLLDNALDKTSRQKSLLAPRIDETVRQARGNRAYEASRPPC